MPEATVIGVEPSQMAPGLFNSRDDTAAYGALASPAPAPSARHAELHYQYQHQYQSNHASVRTTLIVQR
jgi:hypothetical protein